MSRLREFVRQWLFDISEGLQMQTTNRNLSRISDRIMLNQPPNYCWTVYQHAYQHKQIQLSYTPETNSLIYNWNHLSNLSDGPMHRYRDGFVLCADITDDMERIRSVYLILDKLPRANYELLELLIHHLSKYASLKVIVGLNVVTLVRDDVVITMFCFTSTLWHCFTFKHFDMWVLWHCFMSAMSWGFTSMSWHCFTFKNCDGLVDNIVGFMTIFQLLLFHLRVYICDWHWIYKVGKGKFI